MSLGRAANSTPRRTGGGVLWAGNTPWGRAPAAGGEREPAHEPLSLSPWLCCEAQEQETLPSPRLIRKVLVPVLRGGATLLLLGCPVCAHAACTIPGAGCTELAASHGGWVQAWTQDPGGPEPKGRPCLSPAAPRDVRGEGLSQPCPRHPL